MYAVTDVDINVGAYVKLVVDVDVDVGVAWVCFVGWGVAILDRVSALLVVIN